MDTNTTHNGIEYFGIATYEEVNDLIGQDFFPSNEWLRCLSKDVADKCDLIKYTDTDTNGGKLLRYDSIEIAQKTITLRLLNMSYDYAVYIHSFSFTFKDMNTGLEQTETSVPNETIILEPHGGESEQNLIIKNYRDMAVPKIGAPLNVTLKLSIMYTFYSYYPQLSLPTMSTVQFLGNGGKSIKINCQKDNYGQFGFTDKTLTDSGYWTTVSGINQFNYITEEINPCWPLGATKITYGIYDKLA